MCTPPTLTVAMVEKITMEMALVGPAAMKREEPHSAARTTGSMQAYMPYCGCTPAMMA